MLHKFPFPNFGDPGFYRSSISYSAFFESTKRRNWSKDFLFCVDDGFYKDDWTKKRDADLPVTEHSGLLDFFKGIGYDRASKKFLNTTPTHEYDSSLNQS